MSKPGTGSEAGTWNGFSGNRRKKDPAKKTETPIRTVRYTPDLRPFRPSPVPKTKEIAEALRSLTYSATSLDSYLGCSLRFYYRYVLGLREREEIDEEIEARDVGTLVHRVLEEDFTPLIGRPLRPEDFSSARMENRVEAAFHAAFGENLSGRAYLMMLQTKRHLGEYIERCQAVIVREARAEGKDVAIRALEKTHTLVRRGFGLSARFDRLETRGQDLFVLDYKTSGDAAKYGLRWDKLALDDRAGWPRAVGSLQMPLYAILAADLEGKEAEDIRGRFIMLGKNRMGPEIEVSPYEAKDGRKDVTPEKRAERVALMGELIDRLLGEIVNPKIPFSPAADIDRACLYCDFKNLCNRA